MNTTTDQRNASLRGCVSKDDNKTFTRDEVAMEVIKASIGFIKFLLEKPEILTPQGRNHISGMGLAMVDDMQKLEAEIVVND